MIIIFFSKRKKYLLKVLDFLNIIYSLENNFTTQRIQNNLLRKYKPIYNFFKLNFKNKTIKKFLNIYSNLENYIQIQNSLYLKKQLQIYDNLLNNIDGKSLDMQQKMAVLSEETNNLVIARCRKWKNSDNFWESQISD